MLFCMSEYLIFRIFIIFALCANTVFSSACPAAANSQNSRNESPANVNRERNMQNPPENKDVISKDIDELAENINLPARPAEAVWKKKTLGNPESRVPGPT